MAGELWRAQFQIGKELSYGADVAATRRLYCSPESALTREREPRAHRFQTGTRDNVRAFTLGPEVVGGTLTMPLSSSEIIELLLITLQGGVTPTGAGAAKLWTFVPGASLDSATLEWFDGAQAWAAHGVYGNTLRVQGSANGTNTLTCEVFGKTLAQEALTPALPERTPDFLEGWETKVYVDDFGDTPGTTAVADTLINWDVTITNNLARKYFANNANALGRVVMGELQVEATLTVEAASADAIAEFSNWDGATKRLVRLEFGQNQIIEGTDKTFVTIDIPGAWSAWDLGQTDEGTRVYGLRMQYIYDPTNTFGVQVRCQNARATAWAA